MGFLEDKVLVHVSTSKKLCVEPSDIYYVEAVQGDTYIRMRKAKGMKDIRMLGELEDIFEPHGFLRIHRNYMVNLYKVREIRRRKKGRDWELKLDPPVNKVLPVSRNALKKLWGKFGE